MITLLTYGGVKFAGGGIKRKLTGGARNCSLQRGLCVIESQIPQVIRRKDSCGFGAGVDELLCGFNYRVFAAHRPTSLPLLQYMQFVTFSGSSVCFGRE